MIITQPAMTGSNVRGVKETKYDPRFLSSMFSVLTVEKSLRLKASQRSVDVKIRCTWLLIID